MESGREGEKFEKEDEFDEQFLTLIEKAETDALAMAGICKRPKLSGANSGDDDRQENHEGSYIAALRGSRSALWQRHENELRLQKQGRGASGLFSETGSSAPSSTMAVGACFKCGVAGHWARECGGGQGGSVRRTDGLDAEIAEIQRPCPCGNGTCLVLTSNTPKNPGRLFYRCPLKEENGGCNFFEWCDSPSSGFSFSGIAKDSQSNSEVPILLCPCGAGSCFVHDSKSGKNEGRKYYKCPGKEGSGSCGFFKWCNEHVSVSRESSFSQQFNCSSNISNSQISIDKPNSSCFKCGQEGHWAKNCQNQSSNSLQNAGKYQDSSANSGSSTGSCFKCGKSGHWARDCSAQISSAVAYGKRNYDSSQSSCSYKCKK